MPEMITPETKVAKLLDVMADVGGNGDCEALNEEMASLGLSERLEARLRELVCGTSGKAGASCPLPRSP